MRSHRFVVTTHADDELDDDDLTIFDVERCILTGRIVERQKDQDTGEWKYLVQGQTLSDEKMVVVCKLGPSDKAVIITVYAV